LQNFITNNRFQENPFLPNFYGGFKVYYILKQGRSEMHLGAEFEAMTSFTGIIISQFIMITSSKQKNLPYEKWA
jgi:hypothetical protein